MKSIDGIGLRSPRFTVALRMTSSPFLWDKQLRVGVMKGSIDLAERAEIGGDLKGIDLCCGTGGGMRVLVRFRNVASMVGVDATARNVESGQHRCREEGLDDRIRLVLADACESGLPTGGSDFVWGEDARCYVPDKAKLISEAARLVLPGGVIAFTDWVEGPVELTEAEAERLLRTMSFANVQDLQGYIRW